MREDTNDENDGANDGTTATSSDSSEPKEKTITVPLTLEEYKSLSSTKEGNGFTWKGMLMHAQRKLEEDC